MTREESKSRKPEFPKRADRQERGLSIRGPAMGLDLHCQHCFIKRKFDPVHTGVKGSQQRWLLTATQGLEKGRVVPVVFHAQMKDAGGVWRTS